MNETRKHGRDKEVGGVLLKGTVNQLSWSDECNEHKLRLSVELTYYNVYFNLQETTPLILNEMINADEYKNGYLMINADEYKNGYLMINADEYTKWYNAWYRLTHEAVVWSYECYNTLARAPSQEKTSIRAVLIRSCLLRAGGSSGARPL